MEIIERWHNSNQPGEDAVEAYFFTKPTLLVAQSKKEGREVTQDATYVAIRVKGNVSTDVVRRPAQEADYMRFQTAYRAYLGEDIKTTRETPIEHLEGLPAGMALEWRGKGVRTIEDLARMPDSIVGKLGYDAASYHKKAREAVGYSAEPENIMTIKAENSELRDQMALMQQQMGQMMQMLQAQHADTPKEEDRPQRQRRTKAEMAAASEAARMVNHDASQHLSASS